MRALGLSGKDGLHCGAAPPLLGEGAHFMNSGMQSGTAAGAERFWVNRIDHTGFTVSSLEDSLAFWVDALGFKHLYTWTFETAPFIEEMVGVPGAALRLAMVEGPGHRI